MLPYTFLIQKVGEGGGVNSPFQGQGNGSRIQRTLPKGFQSDIFKVSRRKLGYLDAAISIDLLSRPPGNRLEALSGNREDQHSIRVNDQFRLCFRWTSTWPIDVEITDYH